MDTGGSTYAFSPPGSFSRPFSSCCELIYLGVFAALREIFA